MNINKEIFEALVCKYPGAPLSANLSTGELINPPDHIKNLSKQEIDSIVTSHTISKEDKKRSDKEFISTKLKLNEEEYTRFVNILRESISRF